MASAPGAWGRMSPSATKSGTGRATLIRAERGFFLPRVGTLRRLAAVLGVSTDWILTGRPAQPTEGPTP